MTQLAVVYKKGEAEDIAPNKGDDAHAAQVRADHEGEASLKLELWEANACWMQSLSVLTGSGANLCSADRRNLESLENSSIDGRHCRSGVDKPRASYRRRNRLSLLLEHLNELRVKRKLQPQGSDRSPADHDDSAAPQPDQGERPA